MRKITPGDELKDLIEKNLVETNTLLEIKRISGKKENCCHEGIWEKRQSSRIESGYLQKYNEKGIVISHWRGGLNNTKIFQGDKREIPYSKILDYNIPYLGTMF